MRVRRARSRHSFGWPPGQLRRASIILSFPIMLFLRARLSRSSAGVFSNTHQAPKQDLSISALAGPANKTAPAVDNPRNECKTNERDMLLTLLTLLSTAASRIIIAAL